MVVFAVVWSSDRVGNSYSCRLSDWYSILNFGGSLRSSLPPTTPRVILVVWLYRGDRQILVIWLVTIWLVFGVIAMCMNPWIGGRGLISLTVPLIDASML